MSAMDEEESPQVEQVTDADRMQASPKSIDKMWNFVTKFAEKSGTYLHPQREITEFLVIGLAKHVDELREFKWKYPEITNSDLVSFCNSRCVLHLYFLNGFNYVRSEFNDFDKAKDWLQPFLKSMLIWDEDQIRDKLGLESLLPDRIDGLKHSTFMNMVVNGYKNPYFEWEKSWGDESA